jgi:nucleoid-associated protein YgaU
MPPIAFVQLIAVDTKGNPLPGYTQFNAAYNPTELTFEKQIQFAEITIPGLDAPLQQFVRGNAEKLNIELFFDTTESGMGLGATSVTTQTDRVFQLVRINPDTHAPPIVKFQWNHHIPGDSLDPLLSSQTRESFVCVIESIRQKFNLFSPEGIPLRATLALVLREYRPLDKQLSELHLQSPDRTRSHSIAGGETLTAVATAEWNQPAQWRAIADANDLEDPRRLRVGTFLTIPVITPG